MSDTHKQVWRGGWRLWLLFTVLTALLYLVFRDGLHHMVDYWMKRDEYSHGFMIPLISLFLIWQKKDELEVVPFSGSWIGVALVLFGLLLGYAGDVSTLYPVIQYSFIITLSGLVLALTGSRGLKIIWVPLLILAFMVPLQNSLYEQLSQKLQLLSSQIGVAVIRLFDISVYLEGNVIDLGSYKLQVVDACSGLRYLFPLMTLGFIAAYFYKSAFWKRSIIFLSSIPITILMNSFRIGAIGVMVEFWGQGMAEGFLHDFEGWVIFMACTGVLILEMWLLTFIGKDHRPLREVFGLEFPEETPKDARVLMRRIPAQFFAAGILIVVALGLLQLAGRTGNIIPERVAFSEYPTEIGEWKGKPGRLDTGVLEQLDLDDYIIADYTDSSGDVVNLYVAYYASQHKGNKIHSPRACMPGGGWEITTFERHDVEGVTVGGKPLRVNRAIIEKGGVRQLVYYWLQQRGRIIANEYKVKWFMLQDAITRNRTDGALVRLVTYLPAGKDIREADELLTRFSKEISKDLEKYVPK
jgi:exosortase D (VPLPA-CTERM-specific)